jgi:hypothetical protein
LQGAGVPLYAVSAVTGDGLPLLLEAVWKKLVEHEARGAMPDAREDAELSRTADRASHIDSE